MNTLTSDHVKCHFVRPAVDAVAGGEREEVLREEVRPHPGSLSWWKLTEPPFFSLKASLSSLPVLFKFLD